MKILYMIYAAQSGVIHFLSDCFVKRGIDLDILNVAESIHPLHKQRLTIYSFTPQKVFNAILSMCQFGTNWKKYIMRTPYAFERMGEFVCDYLKHNADQYDLILQSGCLFGITKFGPNVPYALYIDQTYQISRKYQRIPGLGKGVIANKKWEKYEKLVYNKATHIFTMSEYAKTSLVDEYLINDDKIIVVGAGPNLKEIPKCSDKRYDNYRILFVGIDFIRKGGPQLLAAFGRVRHTYPNAELVIVGPRLKVSGKNVIVKGYLDHEAMNKVYSDASLFVLPTLQEPFGLSFLEAMAYQLPCIGSHLEAIPEIIDDNLTGALVRPSNVQELSEKIITLLSSPITMKEMGLRGHQKIIEKYNWDIVADKILKGVGW